jgi:hypothetical protein
MASNYPTSLDNFTNPSAGASLSSPSHSTQHGDANDAIEALEAKVGIGSSPASGASAQMLLTATGSGGSTWSWGTGRILQVVSNQTTTVTSTTSTTYIDATNVNVSITPKSNTSLVFIVASIGTGHAAATGGFLRLLRSSTVIGADPQVWFYTGSTDSQYSGCQNTFTYLDSPATTSALTYKVQVRGENASGVSINRSYAAVAGQVMASTMTAFEISV